MKSCVEIIEVDNIARELSIPCLSIWRQSWGEFSSQRKVKQVVKDSLAKIEDYIS